jgi:hypothetical protein
MAGMVAVRHRWQSDHSAAAISHRARLDTRIPELDWDDVSLPSAVDQLCRSTGARIQINAQISTTVPGPKGAVPLRFHARLHNARLATVLDIIADATHTGMYGRTTYEVRPDGTLLLLADSSAERIVRFYSVGDLTDPAAFPPARDPLSLLIRMATNQVPIGALKSPGQWIFVGTQQEQAGIAAALDALRGPPGKLDQCDETAESLGRMVGPVHAHAAPLATVIDTLAAQAGVNLVIAWPSLPQYSTMADPNRAITVDFERLPLRVAINLLLKDRVVFSASDNVLFATPHAPPILFQQVRAYELSDLIALFADYFQKQDVRPGRSRSMAPSDYHTDEAIDLVKDLAQRSAPAGTGWFHGGYGHWFGTRLVVAAPADEHWELRRIFQALRQFRNESALHTPAEPRFLSNGQAVFALLNEPVKEISLDQASLPTALASVQSAAGVTIGFDAEFVRTRAQPTRAVTLHLRNVSLAVVLHEVLKAASNSAPLGYGIDQGVILVGNEPPLWSVTRVYDIRDIAQKSDPNLDPLPKLINACIDAATPWESLRNINTVREVGGWLIATQTPENHLRIESLLKSLRSHGAVDAGGLWPDN